MTCHTATQDRPRVFERDALKIELDCQGSRTYEKMSFPVKYGRFSRLETPTHIFEFNRNHELRHAKAKGRAWPDPSEWLKRTVGNDWVYYSTGGYSGVFEAIGEYYLPNLMYTTNSLLGGKPFKDPVISSIVQDWPALLAEIDATGLPEPFARWLEAVRAVTPGSLEKKAARLFDISGSRVTVMPPDCRHVDYNIIPITISDGCLYKCRFCRIKNKKPFRVRSRADIQAQIRRSAALLGPDLVNYNAVFLGEHDALNAPGDTIIEAIDLADQGLGLSQSHMRHPQVFLFGSVDALLGKEDDFFKKLGRTGMHTSINIGLESCDQATLDRIGKPLTQEKVIRAFHRARQVNQAFDHVEITGNFIMDQDLPQSHHTAVEKLLSQGAGHTRPKGSIYLSPLKFGTPSRQVLYDFYRIKTLSRLPTFLYIIQRL